MIEFDIVLNEIRLRVICEKEKKIIIEDLLEGHSYIQNPIGTPTYSVMIVDTLIKKKKGTYVRMIDKWFDNAECDVWIDNNSKMVYMSNIEASNNKWKELLIQYFVCNLFNRLLEEIGYIAFHSSCVEKNGTGISFIAPRNSGKTNCMLNLMNAGYNSVSNDKVAIMYDGLQLNCYGVAQDVAIRLSPSFLSQSQNQKYLPFAKMQRVHLINENGLECNKIQISSVELAKLNNVQQVPTTTLKSIIYPSYDSNTEVAKFKLLKQDEKRKLLKSQQLPLVHNTTEFLKEVKSGSSPLFDKITTFNKIVEIEGYELIQGENSNTNFIEGIEKILKK